MVLKAFFPLGVIAQLCNIGRRKLIDGECSIFREVDPGTGGPLPYFLFDHLGERVSGRRLESCLEFRDRGRQLEGKTYRGGASEWM